MATARGRTNPGLIERLLEHPHRFDFFQAVRALEWHAMEDGAAREPHHRRHPVGMDANPTREVARFRAAASLSFPAGSLVEIRVSQRAASTAAAPSSGEVGELPQYDVFVSFMGLTGPSGVLPVHYTRLLMERIREKDYSLRDFFDVFNHRVISLFYRAWEKYRFPSGYQRARGGETAVSRELGAMGAREEGESDDEGSAHSPKPNAHSPQPKAQSRRNDLFTTALYCLAGMGTNDLRGRMKVDDESFLYYSGYFADRHRPAVSLERMVGDYFEVEARVEQFQGQWLNMSKDDCSCMPSREHPRGRNNRMGMDTVLGDRVWDVQSRFRVRLGPLTYAKFHQFTPAGNGLEPLCQLVRTYVGPEFDFDVQPVLLANEVPMCQLGSPQRGMPAARLGWNTWMKSRKIERDFEGATFRAESV